MTSTTEHTKYSDGIRLSHILSCIHKIDEHIKEQTFDSFMSNKILHIAISKWIEVIGEAAKNISGALRSKYAEIPWQQMINLRNHILYEYYEVDYLVVWHTALSINNVKQKIEAINLN